MRRLVEAPNLLRFVVDAIYEVTCRVDVIKFKLQLLLLGVLGFWGFGVLYSRCYIGPKPFLLLLLNNTIFYFLN